jgi:biopolymer transport protein ExbD
MAMRIGPEERDEDVMVEINTTPLIDVMLVLLIMLIITIPMQTHSVTLDLPVNAAASTPPRVVNLAVAADGALAWDGMKLADAAALDARLRAAAAASPQPEIHLHPDPLAKYDHVAKVLAAAQRLGVKTLGIVAPGEGG